MLYILHMDFKELQSKCVHVACSDSERKKHRGICVWGKQSVLKKKKRQKKTKKGHKLFPANVLQISGRHSLFLKWYLVRDFTWSGPWVVVCFCWPAELWFLPERALKQGGSQDLGCSVLYFSRVFLCTGLYHFMFASCINSCGGVREVAGPDPFRENGALYARHYKTG